jgi:hypothetical protein
LFRFGKGDEFAVFPFGEKPARKTHPVHGRSASGVFEVYTDAPIQRDRNKRRVVRMRHIETERSIIPVDFRLSIGCITKADILRTPIYVMAQNIPEHSASGNETMANRLHTVTMRPRLLIRAEGIIQTLPLFSGDLERKSPYMNDAVRRGQIAGRVRPDGFGSIGIDKSPPVIYA